MHVFDNLKIGVKLALLVCLTLVCVIGGGVVGITLLKNEMMQGRVDELQAVVDATVSTAEALQKRVEKGELTRDQALASFAQSARSVSYNDGQGYIFVYGMDGMAISVPNASQVGHNQIDQIINGRAIIKEIRDAVASKGHALIEYDFPHAGTTEPAPKISYATTFPTWNVFIGTGAYVDDINARFRPLLISGIAGLLGLTVVIGGAALVITRRVTRPLSELQNAMASLSSGHLDVAISGLERRDEIGAMGRAVQVFKAAAIEKLRLEADAEAAGRLTEAERARNTTVLAQAAAQQGHVVEAVASGLASLSDGDLTHRIEERFPADYEKLRADFNGAMVKLQDTMRTVAASASTIRSGTGEISTASNDLSRRTEQQAASLEETAASLDEITATVRRTAEGAKHARAVVSNARANAEQSGEVVRRAVAAMSGIEKSSRAISQIISVIDEIAFQTNLLALNAGVEAARAGDAGRGFAVVASEVRALAQRSAEAAKEIKALISTSGVQVEQGVTFVGQTGEALVRIVAQVAEIDGIVGEIASSAQEQATGLDEVNTAVNQMDQVTQQNAAMVEESTAASHALAQETSELSRLIGAFRLGSEARQRVAVPPQIARRAAATPVQALRTVGRGGAARALDVNQGPEGWSEF